MRSESTENQQKAQHLEVMKSFPLIWDFERNKKQRELQNSLDKGQKTDDEIRAERRYLSTLKIQTNGVHSVGLLWAGGARPRNNVRQGLKNFVSSRRSMKSGDGIRWLEFSKNVLEWLEKGYACKLSPGDRTPGFIIPTFMVVRLDKATTKYRLIINGAYEFEGKCINDYLLSGESLMNNIHDVLVRFRAGRYVVTGDVSQMFLQVQVKEEDQPFLRFFWEDENGKICIIQATRHIFGLTCSPYVAMKVVRDLAIKNRTTLPFGSKAVEKDTMVDDLLSCHDKQKGVIRIYNEASNIFSQAGMEITKFATNSPRLRALIPPEKWAKSVVLDSLEEEMVQQISGTTPSLKCLGLLYHPEQDVIQFLPRPFPTDVTWTKRAVHSYAAKVYDPLGLLAPALVVPRLLAQGLWKHDPDQPAPDWDDEVDPQVVKKLERWTNEFQCIHEKHIPRCVKPHNTWDQTKLVIFVDSSGSCQASCAYLLEETASGHTSQLWACKQKLTSINKPESIPRSELIAAVLGVNLAVQLCSNMGLDLAKVTFLTDSSTVLWWLRTRRPLSVFVTGRLCAIKDRTSPQQWRHVTTKENAADAPSRTLTAGELVRSQKWWEGPDFLKLPQQDWPQSDAQPPLEVSPELYRQIRAEEIDRITNWTLLTVGFDTTAKDEFLFNKVTKASAYDYQAALKGELAIKGRQSFEGGLRIMTAALKTARRIKMRVRRDPFDEEQDIRQEVLISVLRHAQHQSMQEELKDISKFRTMPHPLLECKAYIAPDGIIRMQGRLTGHPRLKHYGTPAIFKKDDPFAMYYMKSIHEDTLDHTGGENTLLSEMAREVHVVGGLQLAREFLKKCPHCAKRQALSEQLRPMPPLNVHRIPSDGRGPFSEIGCDVFGPYFVKLEEAKETRNTKVSRKRWILIISCCWTRAVNLLIIHHENTKSTSMALDRHTAQFGQPDWINSDQGTNFEGLRNDLANQWYYVEQVLRRKRIEWPKTKWEVNPAGSPRFGGHFESLVKVARRTLLKMLPHYELLTDEEFLTIIERVKCHMNNRPLTEMSSDPQDPRPLCPNDFLTTGKKYRELLPIIEGEPYLTDLSRSMRETLERLWRIYYTEFVKTLNQVKHNLEHKPEDYKVGQFVHLIGDEGQPLKNEERTMPGQVHSIVGYYRVGRIEEIHEGVDSLGKTVQRVFTVSVGDRRNAGTIKQEKRSYQTIAPFVI